MCYVVLQRLHNVLLTRVVTYEQGRMIQTKTTGVHSVNGSSIDAVCINCNKRLGSMRAVSMHLRMTATRHAVNFINHGNYDK
jgi:hypothetical protein